ncbi:MAG TPA: hypothetical protein PKY08_00565 [Candidatus Magasanikbacteria bacterium]|nr:hypothetical protein [Candidatus Magasanikbacteria bacterium]
MKFIFHVLGTIFFALWIAIGAVVLFLALSLIKVKPWQLLSSVNLSGVTANISSAGNVAEVIQKIQNNKEGVVAAYNSLNTTQQDCLKKQLGETIINNVLSGKEVKPTSDMILKSLICVK